MQSGDTNLYLELLKTGSVLMAILILMVGALYLFKKFMGARLSSGGKNEIKLISSFFLGNREKLIVVEVEGKKLLLGVTSNNISLLKELEKTDEKREDTPEAEDFASVLGKKLLKKNIFKREKKSEI